MTATPRGAKPESDDSQNPTTASPEPRSLEGERGMAAEYGADSTYAAGTSDVADAPATDARERDPDVDDPDYTGRARRRELVDQAQSIIGSLSRQAAPVVRQATPVLRELAAKAAELAALAAERAGPIARRAADVTQDVGVRVAARSREVASDLRRSEQENADLDRSPSDAASARETRAENAGPLPPEGTQRPPTTPGL